MTRDRLTDAYLDSLLGHIHREDVEKARRWQAAADATKALPTFDELCRRAGFPLLAPPNPTPPRPKPQLQLVYDLTALPPGWHHYSLLGEEFLWTPSGVKEIE